MKNETFTNNLYDLIKITALPDTQKDDWAELSRKHYQEAKKEVGKYIINKNIEVSGNIITIGKSIKITVEVLQ